MIYKTVKDTIINNFFHLTIFNNFPPHSWSNLFQRQFCFYLKFIKALKGNLSYLRKGTKLWKKKRARTQVLSYPLLPHCIPQSCFSCHSSHSGLLSAPRIHHVSSYPWTFAHATSLLTTCFLLFYGWHMFLT